MPTKGRFFEKYEWCNGITSPDWEDRNSTIVGAATNEAGMSFRIKRYTSRFLPLVPNWSRTGIWKFENGNSKLETGNHAATSSQAVLGSRRVIHSAGFIRRWYEGAAEEKDFNTEITEF